jgi:hypothetical protein
MPRRRITREIASERGLVVIRGFALADHLAAR